MLGKGGTGRGSGKGNAAGDLCGPWQLLRKEQAATWNACCPNGTVQTFADSAFEGNLSISRDAAIKHLSQEGVSFPDVMLHLTIKGDFLSKILLKQKIYEYRSLPYWKSRILGPKIHTHVRLVNGRDSTCPYAVLNLLEVRMQPPPPEAKMAGFNDKEIIVLSLGELVETNVKSPEEFAKRYLQAEARSSLTDAAVLAKTSHEEYPTSPPPLPAPLQAPLVFKNHDFSTQLLNLALTCTYQAFSN